MIIRWKNCTSETQEIRVNRFDGKPDYIARPTDEVQVELPDEDEENSVEYTIHSQVRGRVVFMVNTKKKPKPKA